MKLTNATGGRRGASGSIPVGLGARLLELDIEVCRVHALIADLGLGKNLGCQLDRTVPRLQLRTWLWHAGHDNSRDLQDKCFGHRWCSRPRTAS